MMRHIEMALYFESSSIKMANVKTRVYRVTVAFHTRPRTIWKQCIINHEKTKQVATATLLPHYSSLMQPFDVNNRNWFYLEIVDFSRLVPIWSMVCTLTIEIAQRGYRTKQFLSFFFSFYISWISFKFQCSSFLFLNVFHNSFSEIIFYHFINSLFPIV